MIYPPPSYDEAMNQVRPHHIDANTSTMTHALPSSDEAMNQVPQYQINTNSTSKITFAPPSTQPSYDEALFNQHSQNQIDTISTQYTGPATSLPSR